MKFNSDMTREEAIDVVKKNWPDSNYTSLREALETLIPELKESEDERIRKKLIEIIGHFRSKGIDQQLCEKFLAYLEKQKDHFRDDTKMVEQKPAEWSERYIADVFEKVGLAKIVREQGNNELTNAVQSAMIELSKVGNAEWSEEDENIIDTIVSVLGQYIDYKAVSGTGSGYATPRYSKEIAWLNSLRPQSKIHYWTEEEIEPIISDYLTGKEHYGGMIARLRCLKPKSHWKPSEEQLEAARYVSQFDYGGHKATLVSLYEQLKKL